MTSENLMFHCTHEAERGINSVLEPINLTNLDDQVKAQSTPYILTMTILTNVWLIEQSPFYIYVYIDID